jgi:ABC-type spermidine/putrescine transport system permease subunit I
MKAKLQEYWNTVKANKVATVITVAIAAVAAFVIARKTAK